MVEVDSFLSVPIHLEFAGNLTASRRFTLLLSGLPICSTEMGMPESTGSGLVRFLDLATFQ